MRRTDIINIVLATRKMESYLEIGVDRVDRNFSHVRCDHKVGVDPSPSDARGIDFRCTSDQFFCQNIETFDLIFVDGFHEHEQVDRDIANALNALNTSGVLIIHDALPPDRWHQRPATEFQRGQAWTGTAWKSVLKAFSKSRSYCYIVNADWGCAVIDTSRRSRHEVFQIGAVLDYDTDFQDLFPFVKSPADFIHEMCGDR